MPAQLPHGSTWEDREHAVHRQAWQYHSDEVTLADDLLSHLMRAFRELEAVESRDHAQELTLLLVGGAANFLRSAHNLALDGYYVQALSLARNAYEYWLAGTWLNANPQDAAGLREEGADWPTPSRMREALAAALAHDASEHERPEPALGRIYHDLSRFTHPSAASVSGALDSKGTLRSGPFYQRQRLLAFLGLAYDTATLLHRLLEQSFPSLRDSDWSRRSDELSAKVTAWAARQAAAEEGEAAQ
jgi:hypothetical protein